ncbi:MAG: TetR/AcrR family transcriptional regulator, partial [Streptococcus salivarius]
MAERKISEKSLENLKRFNQENKAITRESIEISLLQLLEKKDFKKITISELVERAGVSRAAFYRNYGSKEEILKSIFESIIAKFTKSLDGYN